MAQGLIIILINKATKLSQFFLTMDKEYRAIIKLGVETDTWDNEGRVVSRSTPAIYKQKELERILGSYVGTNYQEPPMYSAIKYKGRPLYSYARKGKKVEIKKRKINIYSMKLLDYSQDKLTVNMVCSSGTYVRWAAHHLGKKLGCGAMLSGLVRTRIGNFNLSDASGVDHVENKLPERLIGIDSALAGCREVVVKEELKNQINNGRWLDRERAVGWPGRELKPDEMVKIKDGRGHLLAVYKVDKQYQPGKEWLRPMVILN